MNKAPPSYLPQWLLLRGITPVPPTEPIFMEGTTDQIYTEVISGDEPLFTEPPGN